MSTEDCLLIESEDSNSPKVKAEKKNRLLQYGKLLETGRFSDFKIVVGEKVFNVHKCVLSSFKYFDMIFSHENTECATANLIVTDFKSDVIAVLLKYMYQGSVVLNKTFYDNLEDVIRAADKYELPGLVDKCQWYMIRNISKENAIRMVLLGKQVNANALMEESMKIIKQHADDLEKTEEWCLLARENILIVHALKSSNKRMKSS